MKASAVTSTKRAALRVVRLEPADWADTWEDKPREGVAVGLRLVSDEEESFARKRASEAKGEVAALLPSVDAYNDALVAGIVGAALCSPNDVARDPGCLPIPVETARQALTSRALRRLYHELDAVASEASPSARHIEDEELVALVELLTDDEPKLTNRARRLLAAVLDELTEP
jgi:hypothetical protein